MNDTIKEIMDSIPVKLTSTLFDSIKDELVKIQSIYTDYSPSPLEIADLMHETLGTILATYLQGSVEPALRNYIASNICFELAGRIHRHLESLQATNSNIQPIAPQETI